MRAIQPEVMRWARETASLSLDDAARAIGLKQARGESGAERLAKLEQGEDEPPRTLLVKMAKAYRRPLLVFYLNQPPKVGDRGQDFRTLPGHNRYNPELDALIRDIQGRQGLVRSILEDEETVPLGFVGSVTADLPASRLAARRRVGWNETEKSVYQETAVSAGRQPKGAYSSTLVHETNTDGSTCCSVLALHVFPSS